MRVIWSARALERVVEIAAYIARDSESASARWVDELFDEVAELGHYPKMGKVGRGVATPGIRELVLGDFRVFYEIGEDIDVLSVRRASQLIDESDFTAD